MFRRSPILLSLLIFVTCLMFCTVLTAQTTNASKTSPEQIALWFDKQIGIENSGVLNGFEYVVPFRGYKTHPFLDLQAAEATIWYNGFVFSKVLALFDVYTNTFVIKHLRDNGAVAFITVDKERLQGFKMHHRQFKIFKDLSDRKYASSLFEVLFEGETISLLTLRSKVSKVQAGSMDYISNDQYFAMVNNELHRVKGNKSFTRLMKSKAQRKHLTNFIRTQSFDRRNKEGGFVTISQYVDTIGF